MQFLSVAGRELRVAARKPSTFRVRMFTSCLALLVTAFALWFVRFFGARPRSGEELYWALSWVSFLCACLVGPALTADSVNEERNNGTLGLLFLTDLNGISVSLGKLIGHGVLALYAIVAIVPVMALPVLLGGTDAESLAKTALVLFLTLLLSLVTGMLGSTVFRKTWMAAAATLVFLAILVLVIPISCGLLREYQFTDWAARLELLSPSYALSMAGTTAAMLPTNNLWLALAVQGLIALSLFGLITFLLPRVWKEGRSGRKAAYLYAKWRGFKFGSGKARSELRTHLLQINPILWLSTRERFGPMGHATLLLVLAFLISCTGNSLRLGPGPNSGFFSPMIAWIVGIPLLYICFCFRLAAAASERFAVDRKTGALELILCTPMKTREIVKGHWLGLVRRFWAAALLLLALHGFALNYIIEAIRLEPGMRAFDFREVILRSFSHLVGVGWIPNELAPFYIACLAVVTAAVLIMVLWIALGWVGMAFSLKLKREIFAPWLSFLVLAVPPIPLFISTIPLLRDQQLFASNLFLGMFCLGASGFFIVLTNALIWLYVARRWTYGSMRPTPT